MITVRKAILFGARDLRFVDEEIAPPGERQVLVQTEVTALSTGTDLGNYEGRSTEVPGAPGYPRAVGYSNVGIIRECGVGVTRWTPGQRVFSTKPHQSAYVAAEDDLLVALPDGTDSEPASLAYLTQLGMDALRKARYQAGERVAVIGLGVIGLCTVALARAMGARVTAIANSEVRLRYAAEIGADDTWTAGSAPECSADIVVLTANPWNAYREAMKLARIGGRVSVLGFPGRAEPAPDFNPLDAAWLYGKQLLLTGAGLSPRTAAPPHEIDFNLQRNLELILSYMQRGQLRLAPIITHRFPASDMRDAYELALARDKGMAAAVFLWQP